MAMTRIHLAGLALFSGLLLAGCTSVDQSKFSHQVQNWVPLGTAEDKAQAIMERHGFDCMIVEANSPFNHTDSAFLDCTKNAGWFHTWTAQIMLKDEKVSGYGESTVE